MKKNIFSTQRETVSFHFVGERQKDDVYCLWQFGEENHKKFLIYLNGNEKRIQWTQETEEKGTLPFLDMKITKNDHKIQIGIYRKESHTLKYSNFSSNRPRAEQLGIIKACFTELIAFVMKKKGKRMLR